MGAAEVRLHALEGLADHLRRRVEDAALLEQRARAAIEVDRAVRHRLRLLERDEPPEWLRLPASLREEGLS